MPPPVVVHPKENEEGEERIAPPFFASGWAAFDDDNDDQGARKIGAMTDDPVLALDENQAAVGPVVGASFFSAPAAPSSLTTTHQKSVDNKQDIWADNDDMSAIEEGREIGEVMIRRIERRQLRLGKIGVQSSPPLPATTSTAFSSTSMPGADAAADVNTTMDTAAAVAPTSLSMRVIKESLTKKKKQKNIRGTSNNSSHSGSSG
jgi:hypothetical protein